jgi:hypothetical protein
VFHGHWTGNHKRGIHSPWPSLNNIDHKEETKTIYGLHLNPENVCTLEVSLYNFALCRFRTIRHLLAYFAFIFLSFGRSFVRRLLKNGCTVEEIQKGSQRANRLRKERIHTVWGLQLLHQIEQAGSHVSNDETSSTSMRDTLYPPSILESQ